MTVQVLAPRDVQTTLNYYAPLDIQLPYDYVDEPPIGAPRSNIGEDTRPVVVHDARGKGDALGFDVSGFRFVHYPSAEKDVVDEDKIKTAYYAEVEDILKKYAGAKRVFIFDHTIRRSPVDQSGPSKAPLRGPVQRVHVDQTFAAAAQRVEYHLGHEAERLLKDPFANPVAHNPLAVADYRFVDPGEDLISTRHIYAHRKGSTFSVKYNPGHKWYYLSDQTPDEVTLIMCFDSDPNKARLTPHSAFHDSTGSLHAPQRQSIEVRALVFDTE
ncbi:hypothetical protein J3R83DRAFT_12939 [Lanmaoa asiatica]|nr:hypothetical protein J3R83DRAFT_12939 [Lanmaoa asiatica]